MDKDAWIQTYTGKKFYPLAPRVEDICIEDIAHALAMKCRFCGHCREFYSVAQHSLHVSLLVPGKDAFAALMHDAAEAYLPDVCRPIKPAMVGFKEMEQRMEAAIARKFPTLPATMPDSVKHADLVALHTERRDIMAAPPTGWTTDRLAEPDRERIKPVAPFEARADFLTRFWELCWTKFA